MNQAQAIVTAGIRIISCCVIVFWFLALVGLLSLQTFSGSSVTAAATQMTSPQQLDFEGGTVVHFSWLFWLVPAIFVLAGVFSKRLAAVFTPAFGNE